MKAINVLILGTVLLSLLLGGGLHTMGSQTGADRSQGKEDDVIVTLASAASATELAALVRDYDLGPKEIYYQIDQNEDTISGGYTVSDGEDIETALQHMTNKHLAFLKDAISSNKAQLSVEHDPSAVTGLKNLSKQFRAMLQDVEEGNFKLNGLRLTNHLSVPALVQDGKMRSVVPSFSGQGQRDAAGLESQSVSHESWAPYYGTSRVTTGFTFQTFYFNNVGAFGSTSTYEHETQIYDRNFARYDNYWSSNLPSAYYDTPFGDSLFNPTVGSSRAASLRTYSQYYTYMALRPGSARSATVRIKGQKGHRSPSWCDSTWCIYADATTSSLTVFSAPTNGTVSYTY